MKNQKSNTEIKEVRKTSIGGQALMGGIMMKSPENISISVRMPNGEVKTEQEPYVPWMKKNKFFALPIVRGCVNFIESMAIGMKALNKSAETLGLEEEEPSKFEKWLSTKFGKNVEDIIMGFGMVVGILLAVGLFVVLPSLIASFFKASLTTAWATNLVEGVLRLIIFFLYLVLVSKVSGINETFQYHGAEHKTIACYEHDLPLTVENARKMPRLHPRCGTNYLFLVMMISILVFSLVGYNGHWLGKVALRLVMLPLVAGISYEVLRFGGLYDNVLTRIIRWPGMKLQLITTSEPKDSQLAVAIEAFEWALDPEEAQKKADRGEFKALYEWTEKDQEESGHTATKAAEEVAEVLDVDLP